MQSTRLVGPLLALFLVASGARASTYSPEAVLAALEDLYETSYRPRSPGEGPIEVHQLLRAAHEILANPETDADMRREIQDLIVEPTDEVLNAPAAPGQPAWFRFRSQNFQIVFQTEGEHAVPSDDENQNEVPDRVEWVADAFERAHKIEVLELGYPKPRTVPEYTIKMRLLRGVNALTHPKTNGSTWVEFNHGMLKSGKPDQVKAKFEAVAAHEYFHACQISWNWNEPDWWSEGTADYMSERVNPGNGFYLSNARLRLKEPEVGIESDKPYFSYAGSLLIAYLDKKGQTDGRDYVHSIWKRCGELKAQDKSGRKVFVKQAMQDVMGSFEETITQFWPHVYLRNFPLRTRLPRAKRVRVREYPAKIDPSLPPAPDAYGANFLEFHPPEEKGNTQDLWVHLKPTGKVQLGVQVVALGLDGRWISVPARLQKDGIYRVRIREMKKTWRAVTLSVTKLSKTKNVGGVAPYEVEAFLK